MSAKLLGRIPWVRQPPKISCRNYNDVSIISAQLTLGQWAIEPVSLYELLLWHCAKGLS
jgi:hypothetical protein